MRRILIPLLLGISLQAQVAQRAPASVFKGAGVPGSILMSRWGDLYVDTSTSNIYVCTDPASFCGSVGTGEWLQTNSTGDAVLGRSVLTTTSAIPYVASTGTLGLDGSNFCWDATNHRLGIGNCTPAYKLDVTGDIRATDNIYAGTGALRITGPTGATPSNPDPGSLTLYFDIVDGHVKRIDSSGTIVDLESGGGGGVSDPGSNSIPYRSALNTLIPAKATEMSGPFYCSDAGASDTYACSLSPALTSYVTGTKYWFKANTANTGAATINFNSLGAVTIKKVQGGVTSDLATNDIRVGQWVELIYDGTNMQMVSQLGNSSTGGGAIIQNTATGFTSGAGLYFITDQKTTTFTNCGGFSVLSGASDPSSGSLCYYDGSTSYPINYRGHLAESRKTNAAAISQYRLVAKASASQEVVQASTGSTSVLGVSLQATTGVGTEYLGVATHGYVQCRQQGSATVDDLVIPSATTAGSCASAGTSDIKSVSSNTQVVGYWVIPASDGADGWVLLFGTIKFGESGLGSSSVTGLYSGTLDFGSIADGTCADLTFSATGATTGMALAFGLPSSISGSISGTAWVSSANNVTVRLCNMAGIPRDPASATYYVRNLDSLGYLTGTATIDPSPIVDGTCSDVGTITVTGAATSDNVAPGWPSSLNSGVNGSMWVSSANTVSVRLCNYSGATVDVASSSFKAGITK